MRITETASGQAPGETNTEFYLQVSPNLFRIVPARRSPVSFYQILKGVNRMGLVQEKDRRLTPKTHGALQELCEAGNLFFHMDDYKAFVSALGENLDVLLTEDDLEPEMAADILIAGLRSRVADFFHQPLAQTYESLYKAVSVFCEYVWAYPRKLFAFADRLGDDFVCVHHGVAVGILSTILHAKIHGQDVSNLAPAATGYFVHDVGVTAIPTKIFRHDRPLTPKQRESMQMHPQVGLNVIGRIDSKLDMNLDLVKDIIASHHETIDGKGYPKKSRNLSVCAQICRLADSYVAMTSPRGHRAAMPPNDALAEIDRSRQHRPNLVAALWDYAIERRGVDGDGPARLAAS